MTLLDSSVLYFMGDPDWLFAGCDQVMHLAYNSRISNLPKAHVMASEVPPCWTASFICSEKEPIDIKNFC
jgi:hypothetical protein